jgi:hypothetical protein
LSSFFFSLAAAQEDHSKPAADDVSSSTFFFSLAAAQEDPSNPSAKNKSSSTFFFSLVAAQVDHSDPTSNANEMENALSSPIFDALLVLFDGLRVLGMFCFAGLRGLVNLLDTPNALSLLPGEMHCMTRADPNPQNLNKDTKNYRV